MCCQDDCSCQCHRSDKEDCQCHQEHGFRRRFRTQEEQIAELEAYLSELRMEIQAVEERLVELRVK